MSQTGIAVIGPCASGKSSVAAGLRQFSLEAWSVGQEHSEIADLWNRRKPKYVVYLEINLNTLRKRRNNSNWPGWIYEMQLRRLANGKSMAHIVIDTNNLSLRQVIEKVYGELSFLELGSGH